jgi:Leucine Rich repeat
MSTPFSSLSTKRLHCEVFPADSHSGKSFRLEQTNGQVGLSFTGFTGEIRVRGKKDEVPMVDVPGPVPQAPTSVSNEAPTASVPVIQPVAPTRQAVPGLESDVDSVLLDAVPTTSRDVKPPTLDISWEARRYIKFNGFMRIDEGAVMSIKKQWVEEYDKAGVGAKVTTIDLSSCIWTADLVNLLLSDLVESHRLLETVETLLVRNVTSREGYSTLAAIATIFQGSTVLSSLDLGVNNLKTQGMDAVQPLLARPTIRDVSLACCSGLALDEMKVFRETIMPVGAHLTCLEFGEIKVGLLGAEEVGKILATCGNLCTLVLDDILGDVPDYEKLKGTQHLMNGLVASGTVSLKTLSCAGCSLGSKDTSAVRCLSIVLAGNPGLKQLDLSHSGLQEHGLQVVIDSLLQSKAQLQRLKLNGLGLKECHTSQLSALFQAQAKSLKHLGLETNCITSTDLVTLLAPFCNAGSLCQLEILDLAFNRVGKSGAQLLISFHLSSLTRLQLTGNPLIRESQREQLDQVYSDCFSDDSGDEADHASDNESID